MLKIIIIIGLPGSGKSVYIGTNKEFQGAVICDDYHKSSYKHSHKFEDSIYFNDLKEGLKQGKNIVISDIAFCKTERLNQIITQMRELLKTSGIDASIECRYFENNPQACEENVLQRNRKDRIKQEIDFIRDASKEYHVPQNTPTIPVYSGSLRKFRTDGSVEIGVIGWHNGADVAFCVDYIKRNWHMTDAVARKELLKFIEGKNGELNFIAKIEGVPVGFILVEMTNYEVTKKHGPWLQSLFVASEYRKQGIGTMLVEHACTVLKSKGFKEVFIDTTTASDFYRKLGWKFVEDALWQDKKTQIFKRKIR
ncbi:MAG: GNAT family N-acetyltransferase [Candidatus Nanoarchaeia archaeon]